MYPVQLAQDPISRAIVGVAIGPDKPSVESMRQQVQRRTGQSVKGQIVDGNYVTLEGIERAAQQAVRLVAPVPTPRNQEQDRYAPHEGDSAAVIEWRQYMATEAGRAMYRRRSSTCEPVIADVKSHRGMDRFTVRGTAKVLCVALLYGLAYNLMHFASVLAG